jgi:predicted site-specific integrase-resolvase
MGKNMFYFHSHTNLPLLYSRAGKIKATCRPNSKLMIQHVEAERATLDHSSIGIRAARLSSLLL